jgi:hypothetical protein
MMAEVFFALIGTETLNSEASLIFNEGLPGFEDLEDSFRGFIGDGIDPIIADEVVDEDDEITCIAD